MVWEIVGDKFLQLNSKYHERWRNGDFQWNWELFIKMFSTNSELKEKIG